MATPFKPVVHLELHTGELEHAHALYAELCGWRREEVHTAHGTYSALQLARGIGGGAVECATDRALWLPYVEVPDIQAATERARQLGARLLLAPREGPAGWRSVISTSSGGEIAFWQRKR